MSLIEDEVTWRALASRIEKKVPSFRKSVFCQRLWILGEYIYLVLVLAYVKAQIYSTHAQEYWPTLLPHCAESLKRDSIYLLHL